MTEQLYLKHTPRQAFMENIAAQKIGAIIEQFTNATEDGGQEVKDEDNIPQIAQALGILIDECENRARTEFADADPTALRQDAETVVTRKALMYLSEHADVKKLQGILGLSTETNAKIGQVLAGASLTEM